jgi:hypothetical protein
MIGIPKEKGHHFGDGLLNLYLDSLSGATDDSGFPGLLKWPGP